MSRITGELDLSGVATENYDAKLGLRVAVFRSGKLLGSTDLNAPASPRERVSFAVDFEPVVVVGARRPCPVTIVIGPQLAPSELLAIDTVRHVVNFAASKKAEPAGAATSTGRGRTRSAEEATEAVNIGSVAVNPNIYLCWIYCCQTHTIRGRLVCRAPASIAGLAEVHGIGPRPLAFEPAAVIDLVVRLVEPAEMARLQDEAFETIAGCRMPRIDVLRQNVTAALPMLTARLSIRPFS